MVVKMETGYHLMSIDSCSEELGDGPGRYIENTGGYFDEYLLLLLAVDPKAIINRELLHFHCYQPGLHLGDPVILAKLNDYIHEVTQAVQSVRRQALYQTALLAVGMRLKTPVPSFIIIG